MSLGVVFCLFTALPSVGGAAERPKRLALISTPFGEGEAARIARDLLPEKGKGARLVPMARLREKRAPGAEMADAGVASDAGVAEGSNYDAAPEVAERAREAALAFDLVLAAELWRRAADDLVASDAVVFSPTQVAGVLMEAGAASAAAGERALSLEYFRRAIAVDGDILPGPEISPDAKLIFRTAEQLGPVLLEMPRDEVFSDICDALETDGIVWVAAGRDREEWSISYKLFVAGDIASELESRRHKAPFDGEKITAERYRLQGIIARKLLGDSATGPRPTVEIMRLEMTEKKPWYRKWWVYAIGGALVAGGAAGITTWLMLRPREATVTAYH